MTDLTPLTDADRARALEMDAIWTGDPGTGCTLTEGGLRAWLAVEAHVLASHTCTPVWRPTTADEIQPGWEVRVRWRSEDTWLNFVAGRRDEHGYWWTERDGRTFDLASPHWTVETTAPLPEPEPWPDELVDCVEDALIPLFAGVRPRDARAVLDALAASYPGVRAAITGGEQS